MRESPSSRPGLASHEWDIGELCRLELDAMAWADSSILFVCGFGIAS